MDRPQDMGQTLLLRHIGEGACIVTAAAVCDHHPLIVRRDDFLDFLVTVTGANLVNRGGVGLEDHQVGGGSTDAPPRIIGVDDRLLRDGRTQLFIRHADHHLRRVAGHLA